MEKEEKEKEEEEEKKEKEKEEKHAASSSSSQEGCISAAAGVGDTVLQLAISWQLGSFFSSWIIGISAFIVLELMHLVMVVFAACDFSDPTPMAMQAYSRLADNGSSFGSKLLPFIIGFDLTILGFAMVLMSEFSPL